MKENEKKVSVLVEEGGQHNTSSLLDDKKSRRERLKKPLIFALMAIAFAGCLYLIFSPSEDKKEIENVGLNEAVPQATEAGMPADKGKAYEQEMLEAKQQEKNSALTTLSDYWNQDTSIEGNENLMSEGEPSVGNSGQSHYANSAVNSYRNSQSALGSFYKDDNSQTTELQKQLDDLREKLADKDVPKPVTIDDQLALMEKSYQMAAKYLPTGMNSGESVKENAKPITTASPQKEYFTSFTPAKKNIVSKLYRESSESTFLSDWNKEKNHGFHTAGIKIEEARSKNSVRACVQETQTISNESSVRLRLLEPAQTPNRIIPEGTILTANAKFQIGRLQLKITSVEIDGNIIPVDITIYDFDGQPGLNVPYSAEMNALTEMAGNMSQTSGTSIMLTQNAGQQVAADLSRGVVQGISGYFSKKIKTPKVTLKAGHQVILVSKK